MSFMLVPFLEARIEHKRTNGRSSDLSLFVRTNLPKSEWRTLFSRHDSVVITVHISYVVALASQRTQHAVSLLKKTYSSGTVQDFHLIPS